MSDDVGPFLNRIFYKRHAGHIADDEAAADIRFKSSAVPRWRGQGADFLRSVYHNARLWIDRTFGLTRCVLHTKVRGHSRRGAVDYGEYIVRAGVHARLTADTSLGKDDGMRIARAPIFVEA